VQNRQFLYNNNNGNFISGQSPDGSFQFLNYKSPDGSTININNVNDIDNRNDGGFTIINNNNIGSGFASSINNNGNGGISITNNNGFLSNFGNLFRTNLNNREGGVSITNNNFNNKKMPNSNFGFDNFFNRGNAINRHENFNQMSGSFGSITNANFNGGNGMGVITNTNFGK
jgi:hypothetical protein